MLCGRVAKWVLSHGADEIPQQWRGHIEQCDSCKGLIAQVGSLDGALAVDDVPDPGTTYWDSLAPAVARRIEAREERRQARALPARWAWISRWAPAIGIAALAIFVARELAVPPTVTVPLETDLSVTAKSPESDQGLRQDMEARSGIAVEESVEKKAESDGPAFRARPEVESVAGNTSTMSAAPSTGENNERVTSVPPTQAAPAPGSSAPVAGLVNPQETRTSSDPAVSDTPLWPSRRVTIMGEIDSSRLRESSDDETSLAEQGAEAVADKIAEYATSSAETVGTFPAPSRLESPQAARAGGPPDTPNVTAEFRRLDELQDLRRQIGIIQAIAPAERTDEQNERLCAMWYRVGMIASQTPLVDSAIAQLGQCLQVIDGRNRENWEDRSEQLKNRRATLTP